MATLMFSCVCFKEDLILPKIPIRFFGKSLKEQTFSHKLYNHLP